MQRSLFGCISHVKICFIRIWLNRVLLTINMLKCLMNESCVSKLCVALQCQCLTFCVMYYCQQQRGNMHCSAVLTVKNIIFLSSHPRRPRGGQEEERVPPTCSPCLSRARFRSTKR